MNVDLSPLDGVHSLPADVAADIVIRARCGVGVLADGLRDLPMPWLSHAASALGTLCETASDAGLPPVVRPYQIALYRDALRREGHIDAAEGLERFLRALAERGLLV